MSDYLVTDTELTSIADAIRTKGGTSANLSFPTEFVSAINAIQTGSQPTGTKYIYTDETDITEAFDVAGYQYCSIDYAPVRDGMARLWIKVSANESVTIKTDSLFADPNKPTIYWGDGADEYANFTNTHTYAEAGTYCIELGITSPTTGKLGSNCMNQSSSSSPNNSLVATEVCMNINESYWYTYQYCNALEKVKVTGGNLKGYYIFRGCIALKEVDLYAGVTEIGSYCFQGCTALEEITIPSGVTKIQGGAFSDCTALREIHLLPTTPPTLYSGVFTNVPSNCVFYVPQASLSAYQSASNWSAYASQMVGE